MGEVNLDNVLWTQASRTGGLKAVVLLGQAVTAVWSNGSRCIHKLSVRRGLQREPQRSHFNRASRDRSNIGGRRVFSTTLVSFVLFAHGSLNIKTRQPAFDMATAQSVVDQRILAHSGSPWPRHASAKSLVSDQMTTGSGTEERNLQARQNYRLIFHR